MKVEPGRSGLSSLPDSGQPDSRCRAWSQGSWFHRPGCRVARFSEFSHQILYKFQKLLNLVTLPDCFGCCESPGPELDRPYGGGDASCGGAGGDGVSYA